MNEVSRILDRIQKGEPSAAEALLPLVYDEVRKLAAGHMAIEAPGHTLDATALHHSIHHVRRSGGLRLHPGRPERRRVTRIPWKNSVTGRSTLHDRTAR